MTFTNWIQIYGVHDRPKTCQTRLGPFARQTRLAQLGYIAARILLTAVKEREAYTREPDSNLAASSDQFIVSALFPRYTLRENSLLHGVGIHKPCIGYIPRRLQAPLYPSVDFETSMYQVDRE